MNDQLRFAKRKHVTDRLYNEYLASDLVENTEDSLGPLDINRLVLETGVAWYDFLESSDKLEQFWDRVEEAHWDAL